ncbi:MAG: DUF4340 domain-containing protein [Deltaproteobacteria bacterium]|nr:DUF4340 domain-containing protein [Deltaproteobacteria bacterium]
MRKYFGTILLVVLFLALGSYVYFYEIKGQKKRDEITAAGKKVFNINADNIDVLELIYPDQKFKLTRYGHNKWKLTQPIEDEADSDEINKIIKSLSELEKQRELNADTFKLTVFELNKPKIIIQFQVAGEKIPKSLALGRDTPAGDNMYVQVGQEPKAFLVASYQRHSFDKNIQDLRNKIVAPFEKEKVDELSLLDFRNKSEIKLNKKDEKWKIIHPIVAETSQGAVLDFLGTLEGLRAQSFLEKQKTPLKLYELSLSEGPKISFFRDGKKFYARRSDRKAWMVVEDGIDKKIFKDVFAFREKDVLELNVLDVKKIVINRKNIDPSGSTLRVTEGQWMWGDKKLKNDRVRNFLNSMTDTEVEDFIDNPSNNLSTYGLDKPTSSISIYGENNKEILSILAAKSNSPYLYIKRKNQKKPLYKVSGAFLNNLPKSFENWVDKP